MSEPEPHSAEERIDALGDRMLKSHKYRQTQTYATCVNVLSQGICAEMTEDKEIKQCGSGRC